MAQYTPAHRPLLFMAYTMQYWWRQYRVKANPCPTALGSIVRSPPYPPTQKAMLLPYPTPHMNEVQWLAFTRWCLTSSRVCTNQSFFHSSGPPALPTVLQYYCTTIAQYTTPPSPTPLFYAIHHTILLITISCKGQSRG